MSTSIGYPVAYGCPLKSYTYKRKNVNCASCKISIIQTHRQDIRGHVFEKEQWKDIVHGRDWREEREREKFCHCTLITNINFSLKEPIPCLDNGYIVV